jgi:hypothetical protein
LLNFINQRFWVLTHVAYQAFSLRAKGETAIAAAVEQRPYTAVVSGEIKLGFIACLVNTDNLKCEFSV